MPFLEAIRQLGNDRHAIAPSTCSSDIDAVHPGGRRSEDEADPAFRSKGIALYRRAPDILLVRADRRYQEERRKLSFVLQCAPESAVIQALDVGHITTTMPMAYHKEGAGFGSPGRLRHRSSAKAAAWSHRGSACRSIHNPEGEVTIAVVGRIHHGLKDAYKS